MKRPTVLLLVLLLLGLPTAYAQKMQYADFFDEYGIPAALTDTAYEAYRNYFDFYYEEEKAAVAILESATSRALALFSYEEGAWRAERFQEPALCQGRLCRVALANSPHNYPGNPLRLIHSVPVYGIEEYFEFRLQEGEWVFDNGYFITPMESKKPSEIQGDDPSRVCTVTWESGGLVFRFFIQDNAKRRQEGGLKKKKEYWTPMDKEPESLECPEPLMLADFSMKDFPRDRHTGSFFSDPLLLCNHCLGEPQEGLQYAMANHPDGGEEMRLYPEPELLHPGMWRINNGAKLLILEEDVPGWAYVCLGPGISGYAKQEHLAFGDAPEEGACALPVRIQPGEAWPLFHATSGSNLFKEIYPGGERAEVLASWGDSFYYVRIGEDTGFLLWP